MKQKKVSSFLFSSVEKQVFFLQEIKVNKSFVFFCICLFSELFKFLEANTKQQSFDLPKTKTLP